MKPSLFCCVTLALCLAFAPAIQAATTVTSKSPSAIAQITSTQVIFPGGAPTYFPYMTVRGDTSGQGLASRLVFEFSLADIARAEDLVSAKFNAKTLGGEMGGGYFGIQLDYALFGYAGTGTPGLASGAAGDYLAGTFSYKINSYPSIQGNLNDIDVTAFVRQMVADGASYAGFVLRDINTAPNTLTDGQYVVVQDSPGWANDTPPSLVLTVVPEPHVAGLAVVGAAIGLLRRPRRS